jgi:spermidine synthase
LPRKPHSIETSEEAGVRYLHFGSEWVQGAMRIARPYALELEYTREMMACLILRPDGDWPQRIVQIGLGAASITKFWQRYRADVQQTIVEINADVVNMAKQSFKFNDAGIDIQIADGVAWMAENWRDKTDCIMVDGYDQNARFGELGSVAFYKSCRARLSKRGLLVLNLFGRSRGFRQQINNLEAAFGAHTLVLPPMEGGNAIAFAAREALILDMPTLYDDAQRLHRETGLKLGPTLARIKQAML